MAAARVGACDLCSASALLQKTGNREPTKATTVHDAAFCKRCKRCPKRYKNRKETNWKAILVKKKEAPDRLFLIMMIIVKIATVENFSRKGFFVGWHFYEIGVYHQF